MRALILVVAVVCGCGGGSPGQAGPAGPMGVQGIPGQPGTTAKVPHLVVAATGEDLGFAIGFSVAYSTDHELAIEYVNPPMLAYENATCTGLPYFVGEHNRSEGVIGRSGTLLYPEAPGILFALRSRDFGTSCVAIGEEQVKGHRSIDTGIPMPRRSLSQLTFEVR